MTKKSCPLGEDCDLTKARIAALAGEVEVEIDGVRHVCRLTLGAIAEMEAATGESVIVVPLAVARMLGLSLCTAIKTDSPSSAESASEPA